MSKNLTRKGIAFGAIVALGTTLFAGAPASAAGIDNGAVSLAPKTGTEYNVLAGASFELKANFANSAKTTGSYLKFLVEDAGVKTTVGYAGATQYSAAAGAAGSAAWAVAGSGTSTVVTVTTTADHKFKIGDKVTNASFGVSAADANVNGTFTVDTVPSSTTFTYKPGASVTATPANGAGTVSLVASYGAARGTGASYVFDTKSDTNLADKTLRLTSSDEDATQTVIVTAWVDNNDNGTIDSTEYQSPARTVKFLKNSEVAAVTTLRPVSVGDSTVVADVVTTPTLNGDQLSTTALYVNGAGAVIKAVVTRPGDATELDSASTTWSDTTKKWTVTSANFNASSWVDTHNSKPAQKIAATGANDSVSYSVTKNVATVVTGAAHGFNVGDKVVVAGVGTRVNTSTSGGLVITAVPTTTSFKYAVETAQESTTDTASTDSAVSNAITAGTLLRDTVQAGTITVQAYLYRTGGSVASAFEKTGVVASNGVAAKTASAVAIEGVASATVTTAGEVATGATSATFVAKVTDADGAAVAAGVDATITATKSSAGTVTINGTTVTTSTVVYAKTDANGYVNIALTNSSGANTDTVTLDVTVQGVAASQVIANWNDKVYSIVDLNDPAVVSAPARTRAVAEGASYTFSLLVQDQFKAPAGADLRLKAVVTGNTEFQQIVPLSSGKASLAVADGGLTTGDATVALSIEKLTGATWAALADASGVVWGTDASGSGDEVGTVAIKYYTQTDALTLNADAANYPSTTAADFAAATTTKSLVAVDSRVSSTATTVVVAAGKAVVSGAVTNASTGAAKSGQVVTVSGAGLLFKSGDVWSIGSASQIAADGSFAFDVYSNNPGTKVVTVTSGSLTKTASLVFTGASSAVRTLTVSGTQKVLPGSTLQAAILLVDGNGNGVDTTAPATTPASEYISVSYEGPGLLSGSALPTETDKDGKASVRYLLGTGDRGVATVTVKFDKNFDGDFIDATDLTVVRQYLIGVSAKLSGSTATVKNALGATIKVVRGAKSTTKVATSNTQKVTVKGGKGVVKVYVNGVKVK